MSLVDRIRVPTAFWIGVDRLKIGRSTLLREAGLPLAAGLEDAQLNTAQFFAFWYAIERLSGPDIGLELSQALDGSVMPPSFVAAYHARDLGDALSRVARFKALCAPEEMTLKSDGRHCIVTTRWPFAPGAVPYSLVDATMASLVQLARAGIGAAIAPVSLDLRRAPSEAAAAFFGCPIRWNADADRLILQQSDLERAFISYNRELIEMLDATLENQRARQQTAGSIAEQVGWHLRRSLGAGRPELRSIAHDMAMSERSLQRRLNEEGHSFKDLLAETRHQLAKDYLSRQSYPVTEIAYLLGYDDQSSFYRAFQKWENCSPIEWRNRLQAVA